MNNELEEILEVSRRVGASMFAEHARKKWYLSSEEIKDVMEELEPELTNV